MLSRRIERNSSVMPTNDVLESRLRELYREVRTQNEVIDILRTEIIKLAKRIEKLEKPAETGGNP